MGWSTGSCLMSNIIRHPMVKQKPFNVRYDLFVVLIAEFEAEDCDTLEDCVGMDEAYDSAFRDVSGGLDDIDPYEDDDDLYEDDDDLYEDEEEWYDYDDDDDDEDYEDDFGGFYLEDDYDPIDPDNFW